MIGEILRFSNDLDVHMNVRMLCKKLRLWLENERSDYYLDVEFRIKKITGKKSYWISKLWIDGDIGDKELKHLMGIKNLYVFVGKGITDDGLSYLKGMEVLELTQNSNILMMD
jgi:hypothetical protein